MSYGKVEAHNTPYKPARKIEMSQDHPHKKCLPFSMRQKRAETPSNLDTLRYHYETDIDAGKINPGAQPAIPTSIFLSQGRGSANISLRQRGVSRPPCRN